MARVCLLIASAACSILVALLHVYVIVKGAPAYRFFGAGEQLAGLAERGSWLPAVLTSGITLAFVAFAAYYLAAAGVVPKPPYLLIGLTGIAAVYTVRGALLLPGWLFGLKISSFDVVSSLISLAIGLLHVAATWAYLRQVPTPFGWHR
jgi:hypothetical protein